MSVLELLGQEFRDKPDHVVVLVLLVVHLYSLVGLLHREVKFFSFLEFPLSLEFESLLQVQ